MKIAWLFLNRTIFRGMEQRLLNIPAAHVGLSMGPARGSEMVKLEIASMRAARLLVMYT